jgi:hypothetical protein
MIRLEPVLYHLRRDVLAAGGDDDILLPVGDGEIAVSVDKADVAGLKPSVFGKDLFRFPRFFVYPFITCGLLSGSRRRR